MLKATQSYHVRHNLQIFSLRSQSYKRNLAFKKSKLVLNSLMIGYLNLNLITLLLQS